MEYLSTSTSTLLKRLLAHAKDVRLVRVPLHASLKHGGKWIEASYNPNSCVAKIDGELQFQSDRFWDRDRPRHIVEMVGYVVTGLDFMNGYKVHTISKCLLG
jgi:hypothetical protein